MKRSPFPRAAIVAILLLCTTAACSSEPPTPSLWVVQGGWYSKLHARIPGISEALFKAPGSVVMGGVPGTVRPIRAFAFASYDQFHDLLIASPYWFSSMETVLYDPERWAATPIEEQRDPLVYIEAFADLAHRHGFRVIVTPHQSLMSVPGGTCVTIAREEETDAFLRCGIAAESARVADVVEIQAQGMQDTPEDYRAFVDAAASQARDVNPDVQVISGLSVKPATPPQVLADAWASVRDIVDGYYLSIADNTHVGTAVRFLRMLPTP